MDLLTWDSASSATRETYARSIAGFTFSRLETYGCGAVTREIALFERGGREFALVPGGMATLGFDPDAWAPTTQEEEDWSSAAAEWGCEEDVRGWVALCTLRPRTVSVPTLLVQTTAEEVGWVPARPDDPDAPAVGALQDALIFRGGVTWRVKGGRVERDSNLDHAGLVGVLAADGARLPTADEWEYLCGGGARTLFRWGDHAPADHYPVDEGSFEGHRTPNAFGLLMPSDPYHFETVAEATRLRGGDGGSTVCGGSPAFLTWLPLATAFFVPDFHHRKPKSSFDPGYTFVRRVYDIP